MTLLKACAAQKISNLNKPAWSLAIMQLVPFPITLKYQFIIDKSLIVNQKIKVKIT